METSIKNTFSKKVGILGGTFNPIHYGHLYLAENAMKKAELDQILFIPSGVSYMKEQREVLPAFHRMEMTKLAILPYSKFQVSSIEVERTGNSYSYETVLALKSQYPDVKFFFLTGADTIFSMESWKEPASIFHSVTILAAYRAGASLQQLKEQILYLEEKYGADIRLISDDHMDVSSSEIRDKIKRGISVHDLIPQAVAEYIEQHDLYREFV